MSSGPEILTEETTNGWRALLPITPGLRNALLRAQEEARRLGARSVSPELQLLGILDERDSVSADALTSAGVDLSTAGARLRGMLSSASSESPVGGLVFSQAGMEAIDAASRVALAMRAEQIGSEHLLLAMVTLLRDGTVMGLIEAVNGDPGVIRHQIKLSLTSPLPPGPAVVYVGGQALGPLRPVHDWLA